MFLIFFFNFVCNSAWCIHNPCMGPQDICNTCRDSVWSWSIVSCFYPLLQLHLRLQQGFSCIYLTRCIQVLPYGMSHVLCWLLLYGCLPNRLGLESMSPSVWVYVGIGLCMADAPLCMVVYLPSAWVGSSASAWLLGHPPLYGVNLQRMVLCCCLQPLHG